MAAAFAGMLAVCLFLWKCGGDGAGQVPPATEPGGGHGRSSSDARPLQAMGSAHNGAASPMNRGSRRPSAKKAPRADVLPELGVQLRFKARLENLLNLPEEKRVADGRPLLVSRDAGKRALGAILLFLNQELDDAALASVAGDRDLLVPMAVFDWVRDFGSIDEVAAFAAALKTRNVSDADLTAFLENSAELPAGGRSALDLLLSRHNEESAADALLPVVTAPGVAYDVREQAVFKLLEPDFRSMRPELFEKMDLWQNGGGAAVSESAAKWKNVAALSEDQVAEVPYKVWDISIRDLSYLAKADTGLPVRTMSNYLEYGLRRDNPLFEPVIEEGSFEIAKAFLDAAAASSETLIPEEADALDRLSACVKRLVDYDPAFVVDENAFSADYDEEIDVEVLNAEDAYIAELLAADDVEDEEEDQEPDADEVPDGEPDDAVVAADDEVDAAGDEVADDEDAGDGEDAEAPEMAEGADVDAEAGAPEEANQ